jgi:hypothetical protein
MSVIILIVYGHNPPVLKNQLSQDPSPTFSGYLKVDDSGSELCYVCWEAVEEASSGETPIVLWLQSFENPHLDSDATSSDGSERDREAQAVRQRFEVFMSWDLTKCQRTRGY